MLTNNSLDPDAVSLSERLIALATRVPEDDEYGADLLVEVAVDTMGVEQSPKRTSVVALSCEIVNVSPFIPSTYKRRFSRSRKERKQNNIVVSPYRPLGPQG
uniref:Uncharacterized protein n=1 Tax=Nelumbo nucifera TaxID=4432 RepID=A0A822YSD6_NELNU|nr:TPA_asm: hypothetical protein HUJ06_007715 [Nelumbo nucifera]